MSEPSVGIASAIAAAAHVTGVSASYLTATAARESSFDPGAQAGTSSAAGLYQFIESTWLSTLSRHAESLGLEREAGLSREEALALRFDPSLSALLAGALTADNAEALTAKLGRAPSDGELYAAHVLGAGGAADLIRAAQVNPAQSAADLFPAAAQANYNLFYDRSGAAVSVTALAQKFTGMIGEAAAAAQRAIEATRQTPLAQAVSPVLASAVGEGARALMMRGVPGPLRLAPETIELLAQLEAPERAKRPDR